MVTAVFTNSFCPISLYHYKSIFSPKPPIYLLCSSGHFILQFFCRSTFRKLFPHRKRGCTAASFPVFFIGVYLLLPHPQMHRCLKLINALDYSPLHNGYRAVTLPYVKHVTYISITPSNINIAGITESIVHING